MIVVVNNSNNNAMQLELISSLPAGKARETPILFIHGAFVGAWVWAEHFLPYFSDRGYAAHAVSLRGHGGSAGHERLRWTSLREFVADVEQVITQLGQTPILIGHSMGGMVVQKYLQQASTPAVVLMASVPPCGLAGCSLWLAMRDPLLFLEISLIHSDGPYFATVQGARRAIFSADMPPVQVEKYFNYMQPESQRVVADMSGFDLPWRHCFSQSPALVVGAEHDALIPIIAIESTAWAFGTEAKLFPNIAHAMMLEPGWRSVADHILEWLDNHNL